VEKTVAAHHGCLRQDDDIALAENNVGAVHEGTVISTV
jgi:hypothetical protein